MKEERKGEREKKKQKKRNRRDIPAMEAWTDAQLITSRASSLSYVGLLQLTPTWILPVTFTFPNQVTV